MSSAKLLTSTPAPPSVAALVYAGLLLVLIAATTLPIKSVLDQWDEVAALTGTLRLLDAHSMVPAHQDGEGVIRMEGSAFLEGPTVTVAGAVLLQRLGDVVTRHSGSMSSSQLDVQGPRANDGHISVTANFEVAEVALQSVLYELEAGMPYLFVDELVVEGNSSLATSGGKLRVTITVSGQWQGPQ
ncbi:MAG: type II secretion system protein GspM [Bradyrhizobium sp.]|jgi:general secretion pathway protein M|uniref:Type II secretion system protein M n=1 Tax=Bradyrhizobium denitrificans TaxID=2734912 RepID=A0ABS5G6V8_9BRAD|nr:MULTISPECIES: type II secretion system protein GspM [Bradyrhizobium]RTM04650.1 MAG: general secretion pathway protein GspM [Bradyrhizobiaceae bacterium]MBR1137059.1 type II secretion system protein M [Bradyrhizobium denitrificans]MCL8487227.1 type II secretion system protein GspM [Bradyrhizobium denitrificans]MDU0960742.1 type II secretion system protein GspM [Bradyrhizobium sp.]MDU1492665.1 type II secretion system protein GspM [Bradyrhizobium sp.]